MELERTTGLQSEPSKAQLVRREHKIGPAQGEAFPKWVGSLPQLSDGILTGWFGGEKDHFGNFPLSAGRGFGHFIGYVIRKRLKIWGSWAVQQMRCRALLII